MPTSKSIRGSAMMELMLCLLPYALVMMGAMFLWYVQAGTQEIYKHTTAMAMSEGAAGDGGKRVHVGTLSSGTLTTYTQGEGGAYNAALDVDATRDEPILPYDRDGEDIKAAVTRDAITVRIRWDGTLIVESTTIGSQLRREGLISGLVTGRGLDLDADLSFDIESEPMRDLSTMFAERDFRTTVVRGAAYEYASAGRRLPFEESMGRWRSGTMRFGGTDTQTALWVGAGDPEVRGVYEPGTGWNTDAASILEPDGEEGNLIHFMQPYENMSPYTLWYLHTEWAEMYDKGHLD